MSTDPRIEAAAEVAYEDWRRGPGAYRKITPEQRALVEATMSAALAAADAADDHVRIPMDLLESFVDEDECWFDHHGGCQAHGYISLTQGDECPQHELKRRLRVRAAGTE